MNESTKYRLVFKGQVAGDDLDSIKSGVATLLGINAEAAENLISGQAVVLKENLEKEAALAFKSAFEKTGALCMIEPMVENTVLPADFWLVEADEIGEMEAAWEDLEDDEILELDQVVAPAEPAPEIPRPVSQPVQASQVEPAPQASSEQGGAGVQPAKAAAARAKLSLPKIALGAVVVLVVAIALTVGRNAGNTEPTLEDEVARINKGLPHPLDSETREDRVSLGPGKLLTYNFTLVNNTAKSIELKTLQPLFETRLQQACQDPSTKALIRRGASLSHSYKGKDGSAIVTLTLKPEQCK